MTRKFGDAHPSYSGVTPTFIVEAKMEKMKEMKKKMAEKMKTKAAESGSPGPNRKSGEPKEPEKSPHQH